ncbi:alpha/beta hydrolase [Adlercreutzia sp. ZJ473]|uniref:alpha/beta hydrolase n=1 Tax=Adlercreutzia sp. ZJ473 TaxID=2722822 RepID=UPI0015558569|nr:alpha/beta hydrolase [Adlercreutzia sp. ZJ473]
MAYDYMRVDDRRDPRWGLPGDVRDNWNNPSLPSLFADVMTPGLTEEEVEMGRAMFEGAFESMTAGMEMPPELEAAGEWAEYWAPGCVEEPDAPELRLLVRLPKGGDGSKRPCIMYFYATGIGGKPEYFGMDMAQYSADLGAVVIAPQYRPHPNTKQPGQLNDLHAAYQWAVDHADELNIDPDCIVLSGYSIGGMMALGLAFRLQRYGITPRGLSVIAPPTDDTASGPSSRISYASENLGCEEREITWHSFFGSANVAMPALSPEIVPGHCTVADLKGFPPVYMHTFESDPNRDEDVEFCNKLYEAKVFCGLKVWPGTNHVTMYTGPMFPLKERFFGEIIEDLRTLITKDCRRPWAV